MAKSSKNVCRLLPPIHSRPRVDKTLRVRMLHTSQTPQYLETRLPAWKRFRAELSSPAQIAPIEVDLLLPANQNRKKATEWTLRMRGLYPTRKDQLPLTLKKTFAEKGERNPGARWAVYRGDEPDALATSSIRLDVLREAALWALRKVEDRSEWFDPSRVDNPYQDARVTPGARPKRPTPAGWNNQIPPIRTPGAPILSVKNILANRRAQLGLPPKTDLEPEAIPPKPTSTLVWPDVELAEGGWLS